MAKLTDEQRALIIRLAAEADRLFNLFNEASNAVDEEVVKTDWYSDPEVAKELLDLLPRSISFARTEIRTRLNQLNKPAPESDPLRCEHGENPIHCLDCRGVTAEPQSADDWPCNHCGMYGDCGHY